MQRQTTVWLTLALSLVFSIAVNAQNNAPRSPLDVTTWGVVYDIPATKQVKVRTDVPYMSDARGTLTIDVYAPPDLKAGETRPAVVFVNAIGDPPNNKLKNWEIYKSWPRLVAAHGLIGISMETDSTRAPECLRGVFDFLASKGAAHGVDGARLGLYAASANVTGTYQYLIGEHASPGIRAAALYYGGVPSGRLRADLPVLFIVAEGDAPGQGAAIGGLWQRVVEAKAPWSLLFGSTLPHAFDSLTDNDTARRVMQQSIAFWKSNLEAVPQPPWQPSAARAVVEATYANNPARAAELLGNWLKENPNDRTALREQGRALVRLRRYDEATAVYEKMLALGSTETNNGLLYSQLASAQLHAGRNEVAVRSYEKAFALGLPPGVGTRGLAYFNLACGYTRLGQQDKALEALSNAVAAGFTDLDAYETDDDLKPLRGEARFQELLTRLPKP